MFNLVLGWLGNLLGGPFVTAALNAYKAKLSAENAADKVAADLAGRELAVQQRELELQTQLRIAEIGKWYEPDHLAAYVFVAYFGKVVVYDVMLGLGSTPALHGSIANWMGLIAMFLFGKRGIENVARIIKR
jgi:hypothetical protein